MKFRMLGPLEVEEDGHTIPLAGPKQRALLALLLLARGLPVTSDRLIEEIWNGAPPETAAKSIQVYVSQLRKLLGEGRLVTRERGYQIVVASGEVDVDRFEQLVREASGLAPRDAAATLREALALFRGEPLADLRLEPWAEPEAARLEERRLDALEVRIEADLALGGHRELVPELQTLVAMHPYRERLLGQLVLALYRSQRQADALEAYREGAARLRNELGLDPSRHLQELEQRILRQDPALDGPRAPTRNGRRRAWKLLVSGALAVLGSAVAAAGVILTRDSAASLESVPPGVAIVDIASGHLVAQIPWEEIRWPALVFRGNGSFWVWTLDGNALVRIDPENGRVLGRISSPMGAETFWAQVVGRDIWFSGLRLVRMDIASGTEAERYPLTDDPQNDGLVEFAQGAGSLWVVRHQAGELLRVDPNTGNVQRRYGGLGSPYAVQFGDGAAWVVTFDGVKRVDASTNTVTSTPLPPPVAELAVGGGFAWVSNEAKGVVYKIDRSGRIVATYSTGDGARDMSYADGTAWVVNQDVGTVTGIDAATGATRTFRFGHPLQTVGAMNGRLLVAVNQGRTYDDRIAALRGRVVRLITPTFEFDHPDPAIGGNGKVHRFIFQAERATCAPLLGYPDAPPPAGQHLVPELAAAMPTLSRDRRTYTFTVRRGFRFAPPSNAPVDAKTVRFSVERALSPRLGPRAPGNDFLGDLNGVRAFRQGRATHIAGIHVRGNRISFTLVRPSPDFLERLALPYFCPVPRDTLLKQDGVGVYIGPAPPGAGPYTFSGPVFNGEYSILKRNPNYGGSRPQHLDWIAFREGLDVEKGVGKVESGSFDATEQYDTQLYPDGAIARTVASKSRRTGIAYRAFPARVTHYLAFDSRRPPFSDRRLRLAIAASIDRRSLAPFTASPFSLSQTPTDRLLPPGVRGAKPPRVRTSRPPATTFRVATRTVRMAVQAGDDRSRHVAELLGAALARFGLEVQPVVVPDEYAALQDPRADVQLASLATTLDYPDPASFLVRMLGHDVPTAWLDPEVVRDVRRVDRLAGARRDRAAAALAARLETRDLPVVPIATQELGTVVGRRVGCRVWNGVDPGLDLAALCLTAR